MATAQESPLSDRKSRTSRLSQCAASFIGVGLICTLALLPILRIVYIISKNSNVICGDSLLMTPLIDPILNGVYPWKNYFRDSYMNGHYVAIPVLTQIADAYFFHWNVYFMLYLGIGFAVVRLLLFFSAFTFSIKSLSKWVLLPFLAWLIFSTSQLGSFEYDWHDFAFTQFGFALGVWALVRFSGRWLGVWLMVLGGVTASWSSGFGPLVWPVFFLGMIVLSFRRVVYYLVWLSAGILASLPYLYFIIFKQLHGHYDNPIPKINLFNYRGIFMSIGYPFSQNFHLQPTCWRGIVGALLCLLGFSILIWNWVKIGKKSLEPFAAPLMVVMYALLCVWQLSIFRSRLVPWYATHIMLFWVGLLGWVYGMWALWKTNFSERAPKSVLIMKLWCSTVLVVLACFYFTSNISYADKTTWLPYRSPTSASCLRNYRTAPTYCESGLIEWYLDYFEEFAKTIEPLESHSLSVFSPHQRWFLQGDFILNNVQIHEEPDAPEIFWSADLTNYAVPFSDYRHLNLFLHSPNSVDWTIAIPKNATRADFHSAIAISQSAPLDPNSDGLTFEVDVRGENFPQSPVFSQHVDADQHQWIPFIVPLTKFAGQTITLHLTSQPGGNNVGDWAMYRFPYLDVVLDPAKADAKKMAFEIRPSNTDLSPSMPKLKEDDYQFDVRNPELWITRGMEAVGSSGDTWRVGNDPQLEYKQTLNICLADYTHFYVRMSATENIRPQVLEMYYRLNDQPSFDETHSLRIPLLGDDGMHEYTFDLKLLMPSHKGRLTGVRLDPVLNGPVSGEGRVQVEDFRLIGGDKPSSCFSKIN